MKFLVGFVLLLVAAQCYASIFDKDFPAHKTECITELGYKGQGFEAVPDSEIHKNLPNVKPVKCFIKCMMEKASLMKDNAVDVDEFVKIAKGANKNDLADAYSKCAATKDDPCDTAYAVFSCAMSKMP